MSERSKTPHRWVQGKSDLPDRERWACTDCTTVTHDPNGIKFPCTQDLLKSKPETKAIKHDWTDTKQSMWGFLLWRCRKCSLITNVPNDDQCFGVDVNDAAKPEITKTPHKWEEVVGPSWNSQLYRCPKCDQKTHSPLESSDNCPEDLMKQNPREVRNINTLAADLLQHFWTYHEAAKECEIEISHEYRTGFDRGVKALQMRFIKAMEKGELDYEKINRGEKK
jgi:hypothetical protein